MFDIISKTAALSINPHLFLIGMGTIYATGLILLIAVGLKFLEHIRHPQNLNIRQNHFFSTKGMAVAVLLLFPFWLNSIGQINMPNTLQYVYFSIGSIFLIFALYWHIWAKINIRFLWSDGIEIKKEHSLITTGAFSLARHPMYASLLMWCWGASLITFNWVTLVATTLIILPLMIKRAKAEEALLKQTFPDYQLYQQNTRMLFPTLTGLTATVIKLIAVILYGYYVWTGITLSAIILLFCLHLYLGYSLKPEKVAFSYRSKSGMMLVFWALSLVWPPFYYMLYLILIMFFYGLKFNCPCMLVYEKYHCCPCFALIGKCRIRKK